MRLDTAERARVFRGSLQVLTNAKSAHDELINFYSSDPDATNR